MITLELKEDISDWIKNRKRIPNNKIMQLRIHYGEIDSGKKIRSFSGDWNK